MKGFPAVRALLVAPLLALVCFTISAAGAGAASSPATRVLAPAPLLPHGAKQIGAVSSSATVSGAVVLQPRDGAALTRFISQVTDKHSPLFHQYLPAGAFAAKFGPMAASIDAVKSQLEADGLAVTGVDRDGLIVHFSAPAAKVESAFRTGLERYTLADGSIGQARTAPLQVPATIAKYVTSVVGLDTTVRLQPAAILRASKSAVGTYPAAKTAAFTHPAGSPTPCSAATAAATDFGGLTDDQIANAYGAFGLYGTGDTGAGQSIAVFELEPFSLSDIQAFDTCYFGSTEAADMVANRLHVTNVDGGQPEGAGEGEAALDIQDVSAFAPGANIDVYEAPNNTAGSLDEYAAIINADTDQVVTTSWGLCEQAVQEGSPGIQQAENVLFEQAAAQGQTIFAAAGDEGSNDCNAFRTISPVDPVLSVDDPASQPYVVAAGGTTIDNATQPALEHVWNDGAEWGAGGGGISESWTGPTWQLNPLVPGGVTAAANQAAVTQAEGFEGTDFCLSDSHAGPDEAACRQLPDVSAQADEFTGAVTVYLDEFGGWFTIGGTSSAAPMWAAMLADVNESPECVTNGLTTGPHPGVGFVNPLLYAVAADPAKYAASFNDITTGNNDQYGVGNPGLFTATTGYDMASGLGSPQLTAPGGGAGLAFYLCDFAPSAAPRPTVSSISPAVGFTSGSTSVTINGADFQDSGNPVIGVQLGAYALPSSDFTVTGGGTITATFPSAAKLIPPNDQTDGAGRYQVTVTLQDGETSAPNAGSWFSYVDNNGSSQPLPAVTGVHTFAGPETGGNVVDIYGSGFTGATGVTFGGVNATSYTVESDWAIRATVPAFGGGSTTCVHNGSTYGGGENATNDICQVQVVVTTPKGSSDTSTILPLYEGAIAFNDHGVIPAPAGEEAAPAATEYDYLPQPTVTTISTDIGDPTSLASEEGGSTVTITGTGFNLAGLESVNFGDPAQESSQNFFNLIKVTGTEIQIAAPPTTATNDPTTVPVSVSTLALADPLDPTSSKNAIYAGIPSVSSVFATAGPTADTNAGPDIGGTPINVSGSGFANQVTGVVFDDIATQFSYGTQYTFTANSDTDLTTHTVAQNPAVVDVQVCTATDCSPPTSASGDFSDVFLLFPPGDPRIDSISPSSGPVTGGTQVTITGENLGCVTSVAFGNVQAEDFTNTEAILDCGSTNSVTVTAPPGTIGTVPVTLTTVESLATGGPAATGSFTYTALPPVTVTVSKAGKGSGTVTSSPAGISCGATCSQQVANGSKVTLTATAAASSTFAGWSGACTGTKTCTVTASSNVSVTATFDLKPTACVVPKVTGKTLAAARRALKGHSCRPGKIKHSFSTRVKKGRVISQRPGARKHLAHLARVNLVVSKGQHKKLSKSKHTKH